MRRKTAILASLALAAILAEGEASAAGGEASPQMADLAWMSGSWRSEGGGARSEEHWTRPEGGLMLGVHRDVQAGRTSFEFLRVEETDEGIVYLASPGGREATPFPLVEISPGRAVFANPAHDFPKAIVYWREGEELCAGIGESAGELVQSWCWQPSSLTAP